MKIKLQNYSLISNEWIDETIKTTTESRDNCGSGTREWYDYNGRIWFLNYIKKEQLIPSEKLALQSWKAGFDDDKHLESTKALVSAINSFLTSEIELPIT